MRVAQINVFEKKETGYLREIASYNHIVDVNINYMDEENRECFQVIFKCLGNTETATYNKKDYGYTTLLYSELNTGF